MLSPALIGVDGPPVFWPDIDLYFKRDLGLARNLVSQLADAGCTVLKCAALHDPALCRPSAKQVSYYDRVSGCTVTEAYADVVQRHVLPLSDLSAIVSGGRAGGMQLVISVYDIEGINFAVAEGAAAVKIPSSNVVHRALIEAACESGLPMVIDTGRSKWSEIERAVSWVDSAGLRSRLILQHSPAGPPAPPERFHMNMIKGLAARFGTPVGLSDHHPGTDMFPIAVALGCSVVEKGIAADNSASDIDIGHALPISEVPRALDLLRDSWLSLGADKRPDADSPEDPARVGVFALRRIEAGERLDMRAVRFAFPRDRNGAEHWREIDNGVARRMIEQGEEVGVEDVESANKALR